MNWMNNIRISDYMDNDQEIDSLAVTPTNLEKIKSPLKISQSLIKECLKRDHCPKQIYYAFVKGRDLIEPSENMTLGRYFESELLGSCRGGETQEAKIKTNGEKYKVYEDTDKTIDFARECFNKLGIDISKGKSQEYIESELLSGNIDHINEFQGGLAIIDVKWTASSIDDRWNGWADAENKDGVDIQPTHYHLVYKELTGESLPFYYFVFGKDLWFRCLKIEITEELIERHKERIAYTAKIISDYHKSGFKGNGDFNKCQGCPFRNECEDRQQIPQVETINIYA